MLEANPIYDGIAKRLTEPMGLIGVWQAGEREAVICRL